MVQVPIPFKMFCDKKPKNITEILQELRRLKMVHIEMFKKKHF